MPRYKAVHHKRRKPERHKFILRNTSKYDINLGDLRYKIPAGKARDLLSSTANLELEDIVLSVASGSISKRLGKTLMVAYSTLTPAPPSYEEAEPSSISFPQRIKSSIILGVGEVDEEVKNLILSEEDEFLDKLEKDSLFEGGDMAPIVAKGNKEDS